MCLSKHPVLPSIIFYLQHFFFTTTERTDTGSSDTSSYLYLSESTSQGTTSRLKKTGGAGEGGQMHIGSAAQDVNPYSEPVEDSEIVTRN